MNDQRFMRRAFELALMGIGNTSPNPMVGCVIVRNEKIIGEGYHKKYGEAHAEVNAIADVKDQNLLTESTAYVSLEPCSFIGNTPACSDLLINKKIKKVVICTNDPHPKVSGNGVNKMKAAGIEVVQGILKGEGRALNRRFFQFHENKRPFVILKWAQTADGFVARENYDSKWISNQYSRQLVHKWRTEEDAIMVGTNTAKYDDPALTARDWKGRNPTRIVIDRKLSLDSGLKLFDGSVTTLVITEEEKESRPNVEFVTLDQISPSQILDKLYEREIQSVLIEGGSAILKSFIDANLWDEARVFTSDKEFGEGIAAPALNKKATSEENVAGDKLEIFTNN